MTMEEVTRYSGSFGDVARMAQNFAGVSGASDERISVYQWPQLQYSLHV